MLAINWTEELEQKIADEISSGMSIREISALYGMPKEASIYRHLAVSEKFAALMGKARAAQQDFEADKCITLADAATPEDWQVVKLQIWARQWRAAKLAPKKYGDYAKLELSGPDNGPIQVEQKGTAIAELIAKAAARKAKEDEDLNGLI